MPLNLSVCCVVEGVEGGDEHEHVAALSLEGASVVCNDASLKHREAFPFDAVYSAEHFHDARAPLSPGSFSGSHRSSAYQEHVYPLVQRAIEGESTMVVVSGTGSLDLGAHVLPPSHDNEDGAKRGLLTSAATDLLQAARGSGAVTFSWFKIDTQPAEGVTDVLKNASGAPSARTMGVPPSSSGNGSSSGNCGCDMSLLVREIGKGRGMFVPGLWEVEISSGQDVSSIIQHVTQAVRSADHARGLHHTVFSLTYKPSHLTGSASKSASKGSYLVAGGSSDPPGLGRIAFVLLSQLSPTNGIGSGSTSGSSSRVVPQALPSSPPHLWVDQLTTTLQWLQQQRPSPPFHKSRLLLMLRDVLCNRQHCAWFLFLPASAEVLSSSYSWLRLVSGCSYQSQVTRPHGIAGGGLSASLGASQARQLWPTPSKGQAAPSSSSSSSSSTAPLTHSENPQLLGTMLEAAQADVASLSAALHATQIELAQSVAAYNALNADGANLVRRDQEKYKKALADVQEHDVYRAVMEAALVRVQAEADHLATENAGLRRALVSASNQRPRPPKLTDDESKQTYASMKKDLLDCRDKLAAAMQSGRRLTKERDQAAAALLEAHHEVARHRARVSEEAQLHAETAALRKRLVASQAREAKNATRDEEHKKATLSKLMGLQEENTLLRDSLFELMHKKGSSRPSSPQHLSQGGGRGSPHPASPRPASPARSRSPAPSAHSHAPAPAPISRSPSPPPNRRQSIRNRLLEPLDPPPSPSSLSSSSSPLRRSSTQSPQQQQQKQRQPHPQPQHFATRASASFAPTTIDTIKPFSGPASRLFLALPHSPRSPALSPTPNMPPPPASANTARRFVGGGSFSSPKPKSDMTYW